MMTTRNNATEEEEEENADAIVVHDQLPSVQEIHQKSLTELDDVLPHDLRVAAQRRRKRNICLLFLAVVAVAAIVTLSLVIEAQMAPNNAITATTGEENNDDNKNKKKATTTTTTTANTYSNTAAVDSTSPPTTNPIITTTRDPTYSPVTITTTTTTSRPTVAPTKIGRRQIVTFALSHFFSSFDDNDNNNPLQEHTLDWIDNNDTWEPSVDLPSDADALWLDRFVVALLYFGTNGTGWNVEHQALWLSKYHVCDWDHGVSCNADNRVVQIELRK